MTTATATKAPPKGGSKHSGEAIAAADSSHQQQDNKKHQKKKLSWASSTADSIDNGKAKKRLPSAPPPKPMQKSIPQKKKNNTPLSQPLTVSKRVDVEKGTKVGTKGFSSESGKPEKLRSTSATAPISFSSKPALKQTGSLRPFNRSFSTLGQPSASSTPTSKRRVLPPPSEQDKIKRAVSSASSSSRPPPFAPSKSPNKGKTPPPPYPAPRRSCSFCSESSSAALHAPAPSPPPVPVTTLRELQRRRAFSAGRWRSSGNNISSSSRASLPPPPPPSDSWQAQRRRDELHREQRVRARSAWSSSQPRCPVQRHAERHIYLQHCRRVLEAKACIGSFRPKPWKRPQSPRSLMLESDSSASGSTRILRASRNNMDILFQSNYSHLHGKTKSANKNGGFSDQKKIDTSEKRDEKNGENKKKGSNSSSTRTSLSWQDNFVREAKQQEAERRRMLRELFELAPSTKKLSIVKHRRNSGV